ncbi:CAP domain-containing protein [Desulfovibrio sp. OttesenSCG-928-A18]|nr:CAP domain-containing protein [Desulfovibrio sp. OttesenSCG-928-A18]
MNACKTPLTPTRAKQALPGAPALLPPLLLGLFCFLVFALAPAGQPAGLAGPGQALAQGYDPGYSPPARSGNTGPDRSRETNPSAARPYVTGEILLDGSGRPVSPVLAPGSIPPDSSGLLHPSQALPVVPQYPLSSPYVRTVPVPQYGANQYPASSGGSSYGTEEFSIAHPDTRPSTQPPASALVEQGPAVSDPIHRPYREPRYSDDPLAPKPSYSTPPASAPYGAYPPQSSNAPTPRQRYSGESNPSAARPYVTQEIYLDHEGRPIGQVQGSPGSGAPVYQPQSGAPALRTPAAPPPATVAEPFSSTGQAAQPAPQLHSSPFVPPSQSAPLAKAAPARTAEDAQARLSVQAQDENSLRKPAAKALEPPVPQSSGPSAQAAATPATPASEAAPAGPANTALTAPAGKVEVKLPAPKSSGLAWSIADSPEQGKAPLAQRPAFRPGQATSSTVSKPESASSLSYPINLPKEAGVIPGRFVPPPASASAPVTGAGGGPGAVPLQDERQNAPQGTLVYTAGPDGQGTLSTEPADPKAKQKPAAAPNAASRAKGAQPQSGRPAGGKGPAGAPAPLDAPGAIGDAADMLSEVNKIRASGARCGKKHMAASAPLRENHLLSRAAAAHAADMAAKHYLASTTPDGVTLGGRVSAAGYEWSDVAENLSAQSSDAEQAVRLWLQVPEQCANLMDPLFVEAGAGTDLSGRIRVFILANPLGKNAQRLN